MPDNRRKATVEYTLMDQVNDRSVHARELAQLLRDLPCKINLIPFNPWPGTSYHCSDPQAIDAFAKIVMKAGYASPIRTPRGRDILAACGQLKSDSVKLRASQMNAAEK